MLRQIAKDHENNENNDDDFHNYLWYAIIVNVYQLLRENFFHKCMQHYFYPGTCLLWHALSLISSVPKVRHGAFHALSFVLPTNGF